MSTTIILIQYREAFRFFFLFVYPYKNHMAFFRVVVKKRKKKNQKRLDHRETKKKKRQKQL